MLALAPLAFEHGQGRINCRHARPLSAVRQKRESSKLTSSQLDLVKLIWGKAILWGKAVLCNSQIRLQMR